MTKRLIWLLLLATALIISACTIIDTRQGGGFASFEERMEDQQRRIDQGRASGSLTRHEAEIVQLNLNWIRMRYSRMQADGSLTQRDLEKIDRMLERNARMISNKKQNPVQRIN